MARLKKLTAVTISVNYADFLARTVSNRHYFDEWIVITCREDRATRAICEANDMRVHVSDQLGPWGDCFDSAYLKAPVINEVLDTLPGEGWVLLIDADLLLPQRFRERLECYDLYPRALYGLYGRRECDSWEEFAWRRPVEPWAENFGYSSRILGFFQLFRLDQPVNRYPYERPVPEMHDDLCFQYSFKPTLRRLLPMMGLHVGPPRVNWDGRNSGIFGENKLQVSPQRVPEVLRSFGRTKALWVVGADESQPWEFFAGMTGTLTAVDWYGLTAATDTPNVYKDRQFLLHRLLDRFSRLTNTVRLVSAERGLLKDELCRNPPDAVFFAPELSAEMARGFLSLFKDLPCLPVLMGQFYGFPQWRATALSVSIFFGPPADVYSDGSWIVRFPSGPPALAHPLPEDDPPAVLIAVCEKPGHISVLASWIGSGLHVAPRNIHAYVRRGPSDGAIVALRAISGINFYDLPSVKRSPVEALRIEDIDLLNRSSAERIVFADVETADVDLINSVLRVDSPIAAAGAVSWSQCSAKEQTGTARALSDALGKPIQKRALSAYPADSSVLAFQRGEHVLDLWEGMAETALLRGVARPVFAGLTMACLSDGKTIDVMGRQDQDVLLGCPRFAGLSPDIKVKKGAYLACLMDPSDESWLPRMEALNFVGHARAYLVVPSGQQSFFLAGPPNFADEIILSDSVADEKWESGAFHELIRACGHDCADAGLTVLPPNAFPFTGASLFFYSQFEGFDLIMEMEVPTNRRDLGPENGKPSLASPVYLSSRLCKALGAKPAMRRTDWRYGVLRRAKSEKMRILFRDAGASGWHKLENLP